MSLLRRRLAGDADSLAAWEKVRAGITSLDVTVNDLLHFTTDRDPAWECFSIGELIDEVLTSLAPQLDAQSIHAEWKLDGSYTVAADRGMLRRALVNLMLNAIDVMPSGGRLTVSADSDKACFELAVVDNGPGFGPDALERAFEPFFTTKSTGTGLGLAIVERVAAAHGGKATAENNPHGGARLAIRIPLVEFRETPCPAA
jgi:signal transduction histidine kinase